MGARNNRGQEMRKENRGIRDNILRVSGSLVRRFPGLAVHPSKFLLNNI
jgi:hypothetical protein